MSSLYTQVLISEPAERSRTNLELQEYVATVPRGWFGKPVIEYAIIPFAIPGSSSHSMAVCVNAPVNDTDLSITNQLMIMFFFNF